MGSRGTNTLSLNANALTGSAGLGSMQAIDVAGNEVTASVDGTTLSITAVVIPDDELEESTATLSNNLVRGLTFANMADNTVSITANAATIPVGTGADASVTDFDIRNETQAVTAAYGLLNVQSSMSDAGASVSNTNFLMTIGDDISDSTVSTNNNAVVGAAFGNETLNNMALNVGNLSLQGDSGAVANVTSAQGFTGDVSATVTDTLFDTRSVTDDIDDSTVSIDGNLIQAQAVGNRAAANGGLGNTLSVTGTNIVALPDADLGGLQVGADGITADTMFSVQNLQIFADGATLNASVSGAEFAIFTDDVRRSTVSIDGNSTLASGTLNQANNGLSLVDITTLESAGGLNSFQSGVGDVVTVIDDSGASLLATDDIFDSSLSVSNNTQQATARANLSANAVTVDATNVTVPGNAAVSSVIDAAGGTTDVTAAFGSLNTQTQTGNLSAAVTSAFIDMFIDGSGSDSSFRADGNVLGALAAANTTTNDSQLGLGNLSVDGGGEGAIGAVTSNQSLDGTVDAEVGSFGGSILLDVGGADIDDVENSTLSVSGNTLQAQAFGNRALDSNGLGNQLVVTGGSIEATLTAAAALTLNAAGDVQSADLAFTVQNRQTTTADSDLTSTVDAALLGISVGDDVIDSTLSMNDNLVNAAASSNRAGNLLEMTGLNAINSSAGVQSVQEALGATTATADGNIGGMFSIAAGGELVTGSTLDLSANRTEVTATGNQVGNTLLAEANGILGGAGLVVQANSTATDAGALSAVADFAVLSRQNVEGDVTGTGDSALFIDAGDTDTSTIIGSSLLLDANVQSVAASGNIGVNVLELSATNLGDAVGTGASGLLLSSQGGDVAISATATLTGEAPGSIENSSLSISSNENRAAAVLNDVANRVTTSGTNLFSSAAGDLNANAVIDAAGSATTADQGLLNLQRAADTVTAAATTALGNLDAVGDTTGLLTSSAVLNSNLTQASATANRASNAVELNASNLGVTGALTNSQISDSDVTSTAGSTTAFALNAVDAVVTGSTIDVSGNSTVAASSGNRATNALSALATAGYNNVSGNGATSAIGVGTSFSADATFGVLNAQENTGAIASTVSNTTASIALDGGADAVTGSTLRANGNQMIAEANGNFARNTLSLSARPGGNGSAALTSFQTNTGAGITASLIDSSMSVSITGGTGVSGNTASVSGNRGIARATGNTAVNRIVSGD